METRSENEGWKKALRGAEASPSPSVWEGIELQLNKEEVAKLRRSVYFYKILAAACVSLALVAFGSLYFSTSINSSEQTPSLIANNIESTTMVVEAGIDNTQQAQPSTDKVPPIVKQQVSYPSPLFIGIDHEEEGETKEHLLLSMETVMSTFTKSNSFADTKVAYTFNNTIAYSVAKSPLLKKEEVREMNTVLALEENNKSTEEADSRGEEKFWTSVGVAAGTFNNTTPTSVGGPANALSSLSAGQTAASETNSSGYSYAVNLAVGAKVSKRWLVHGGMSYISQLSDYTANSVVTSPSGGTSMVAAASINQFEKKTDQVEMSILTTSPYTVNNEIQLISFPVQAGYMLVDRKVALQLNSGISTDLFLQNTITPEAENLEKTTQGRGDDSPYRPLNFSGLIGTEVSYRFSDHYRISLSPGLRYPFNSIYKSDLGIKSSPLTFDVALRFKYILK